MNTNLKHVGFFGLLLLVVVLVTAGFVGELDADTSSGRGANQYGSATQDKVCGDRLCIESGGKIIMPSDEKNKESEETICFSSRVRVPCNELKYIQIEEGELNAMKQEIDDLKKEINVKNQEINKIKNSLEANVTAYGSALRLAESNIPVSIPLHQGYFMGSSVYYIITDSSDQTHADIISKNQDWRVELSTRLVDAPKDSLSKTYMFTNGVKGDGVHGYQGEIFTSTPAQPETYSALTSHVHVTWDDATTPKILASEKEVFSAEKQGLLVLRKIDVVLNLPQIVWPEGQMPVKANMTLTDMTPFVGGQVLDIDLENMTTTFIAHRGFGPDGKTIYCIVTDATPVGPAISMGVTNAPRHAELFSSTATDDMYNFMNGILDSGPMGFQTSITSSSPGDENYSPMWKIHAVTWKNPKNAVLLQTINDVEVYEKAGLISVNLARPMNMDHIVNCPIVDPFQNE